MRKVFDNSMVAHVWAQQTQAEGRSHNGHLYFVGATIFSYGSHYPAARFTGATLNGLPVVFMNSEKYSVSTSRHMREIEGALSGLHVRIFHVPFVTEHRRFGYAQPERMHRGNLDYFVAQFNEHAAAMANPRKAAWLGRDSVSQNRIEDTPDNRILSLAPYVAKVHDYAHAFALELPTLNVDVAASTIRDAFAKFNDPAAVAKRAKDATKRKVKRELEHAGLLARVHAFLEGVIPPMGTFGKDVDVLRRLDYMLYRRYTTAADAYYRATGAYRDARPKVTPDQWRAGAGSINALPYNDVTLLRRVDDRLQTSRGVEVPFQHAVVAFFKAQRCRRTGATWHRNGETVPVGHFQVDSIDAEGNLRAGCHTLQWDEMLRLAVREIPEQVRATFPVPALIAS